MTENTSARRNKTNNLLKMSVETGANVVKTANIIK